jgi:hypothetical protein
VEVAGESLYGVQVEGDMTGPGPIVIHAQASLKILFVRISGSVTIRLGDDAADLVTPISDLVERLRPELKRPANLRAEGEDNSVLLAPQSIAPGAPPPVAAVGALIWEQKRAPLGRDIERLEGADLAGTHHLELTCTLTSELERDWFSVGSYARLSDSEAMNNARFTQETSGVKVGAGTMDQGSAQLCPIEIEVIRLPQRVRLSALFGPIFSRPYTLLALGAVQAERGRFVTPVAGEPIVRARGEQWTAYDRQGQAAVTGQSPAQAFMVARRTGGVAAAVTDAPVDLKEVF